MAATLYIVVSPVTSVSVPFSIDTHELKDPVNLSCPSTSSKSSNSRCLSFGFAMIVIPEDTSDREFIERLLSELMLSTVKAPSSVSRSGAARVVRPDAPSAVKDPLISVTLFRIMEPLADEEMVTLPSIWSQLAYVSASLWLEMVALLEPSEWSAMISRGLLGTLL